MSKMHGYFEDVDAWPHDPEPPPPRAREVLHLERPIRTLPLRPPLSLEADATAASAVELMRARRQGSVLVTERGRLVGIFTERDVLTKLALGERDPRATPLREVMRADPETLLPEQPMAFALNAMSVGGFRHVPLVDAEGRAVGVVSVRDIANYLVEQCPEAVLNLPPRPDAPRSREGA